MERVPQLTTWTARSADQVGASCAALVLPGGYATGHGRYCPLLDLELRGLGRTLADRGADRGLAVHLLRYRNRGWNGARADPVVDTRWALTRLADRHGPVPVILVGYSMGGRAAVWAAGGANVTAVVAIAPWLPGGDPVDGLQGRRALILHGSRDRSEARPELSLAYAERARALGVDLVRRELPGIGHHVLWRSRSARTTVTDFVLEVTADPS